MFPTVLENIGCTPVVRLQHLAPEGAHLYAKLESANPGGSLKDRMALAMIESAERSGELRPGQTVVEASSGNTGISLAMVCAAKGYPLVVVMAEQFSVERRRLMRFLGARVVLTPAALKGSGMVEKARELAQAHGWFWCRQFENPANAEAHARTTAREILADFDGRRLDAVVLGAGTGGTLRGIAEVLRRERPGVRVLVCEPDNAPVLAGGQAMPGGGGSHPSFRPHPMQGWTPDFIPVHTGRAFAAGLVDRVLPVDAARALWLSRELARREGLLCGVTSGATLAGALQFVETAPDAHVLCLFPDSAERYLSTPLFDAIGQDMDDAEWAIARSTPGARFDQPVPALRTAAPPALAAVDAESATWLARALGNRNEPVVVFGLAWCEYAGSVRRLLDRCGVRHRWIELDAPALQAGNLGNRTREALRQRTGMATLPQVFISGELLGGCSETFAAYRDGRLVERLQACAAMPADWPCFDAESLLPQWRHPTGRAA